jgi:hypothetical protein
MVQEPGWDSYSTWFSFPKNFSSKSLMMAQPSLKVPKVPEHLRYNSGEVAWQKETRTI